MLASNTLSGKSNDPTSITASCRPAVSSLEGGPRLVPGIHPEHIATSPINKAVRYIPRLVRVIVPPALTSIIGMGRLSEVGVEGQVVGRAGCSARRRDEVDKVAAGR